MDIESFFKLVRVLFFMWEYFFNFLVESNRRNNIFFMEKYDFIRKFFVYIVYEVEIFFIYELI